MRGWRIAFFVLAALTALGFRAIAEDQNPRRQRIAVGRSASAATVTGQLTGDAMVDYLVRGAAGQTLEVRLKVSNPSNYFNVLPPGSADAAMFAPQTGEDFKGMLPTDGDYAIRVYLVRAAARRNETSDYTLTIRVTGAALLPLPASQDAVIPGTPYHASTSITCLPVPYGDAKPTQCQAFAIRRGTDGTATVEIDQTATTKRRILFIKGKPVASDAMRTMTASRQGDMTLVIFESGERYEIPDALIFGG